MLNAVLKIVGGKQDGKLIPLPTKKFLIGTEQDCHLRPSSDSVSRHHCAISIDNFGVRVRDLGSSNGTFLNGTRLVGVQAAQPGDNLKVGILEFKIQFQLEGAEVPSDSGSNTTFSLNDFDLDRAAPAELAEETVIVGGDTALIVPTDSEAGQVQPMAEPTPEAPLPETIEAVPAAESAVEPVAPETVPAVASAAPLESPTQAMPAQPAAPQPMDPAYGQQVPQPGMPFPGQQAPGQQMPGQPMPGQPMPGQMPGYPPMQQPGYPYGMPQQQQPFNPYMPQQQQPGYPPMQQPQYGMPYPQQPQPFPPQPMPGYPAQPVAPVPRPAPEAVAPLNDDEDEYEDDELEEPEMVLPPPEETGIKDEKKSETPEEKSAAPAPNPAADILKKYSERR